MMQPYRQPAAMVKEPEEKSQQGYGLIIAPKNPPPKPEHHCKPPGFLTRLLYWLSRKEITEGSLWRCHCGQIWKYYAPYWGYWSMTATAEWFIAGGDRSEQDKLDQEWKDKKAIADAAYLKQWNEKYGTASRGYKRIR